MVASLQQALANLNFMETECVGQSRLGLSNFKETRGHMPIMLYQQGPQDPQDAHQVCRRVLPAVPYMGGATHLAFSSLQAPLWCCMDISGCPLLLHHASLPLPGAGKCSRSWGIEIQDPSCCHSHQSYRNSSLQLGA